MNHLNANSQVMTAIMDPMVCWGVGVGASCAVIVPVWLKESLIIHLGKNNILKKTTDGD